MTSSPAPATSPDATDDATSRRARRGFLGYDWANSGWLTVVTTAVGGPYLDALAAHGRPLQLGPVQLPTALVLPATLVLAVLVQVVLLPLLGRRVDAGVEPAALVRRFALAGGAAGLVLALAPAWPVAALAMAATTVCFGAAMVPYNSLLPRLAPGREADRLSARAFAAGYVGGGLLLALTLALLAVGPLGLGQAVLVRVAIAAAAAWWAGFGVLATRGLAAAPGLADSDALSDPPSETGRVGTLRLLRDLPQLRAALVGSLLLGDAVGAVVALSATVLTHELWTSRGRDAAAATGTLLTIVLLIQVLAAPAAVVCGRIARRIGARPVLLGCLAGWVVVLAYAFLRLHTLVDAYVLAVGVALVLGGSQTLARSLVAQCTPPAHAGAVFSVTQLAERGTAWIGPSVFAAALLLTGSYRAALASLLLLFVVAAVALARVDAATGRAEAETYSPSEQYELRRLAVGDPQLPGRAGRSVYAVAALALDAVLRLVAVVRTEGRPLPAGGVVVVANHRSVADGPVLAVVGRRGGRQLRMLGTAGVFTAPLLGRLLLAAGMVPVKRRTVRAGDAVTGAVRLLRAGEAVALFPEGRITHREDALPEPLRSGAVRLALAAGVPVVAVGTAGTEQVVPEGTWRPVLPGPGRRRARVSVRVSAPLDLHAALGLPAGPVADPDAALVREANRLVHALLCTEVLAARSARVPSTARRREVLTGNGA
ncbi:MAG: MFS transporter [Motilibacteraceae bacterium]